MVSSIVPGTTGANALGVDQRFARPASADPQKTTDSARGGDSVSLTAVRDSVRAALSQVHQALAVGHDAQTALLKVLTLSQSGDANAQSDLDATLASLAKRVSEGVERGASLLAGATLSVQAEPGAAAVEVAGADLRLKSDPGEGDVIAVRSNARVGDADLAVRTQDSLDRLQVCMDRLLDAARALEAHQGFIGVAEGASAGVRHDLDADSARLLALQVRQGLDAVGGAAIANVEPQAVLALFRA